MEQMQLVASPTLLDAPVAVVNMAIEGDLAIRRDHSFVLPFLTGQEGVAWAKHGDELAGCEVWTRKDDGRMWEIRVGYVAPQFRKQGVLGSIRNFVRGLAQHDLKCQCIEFLVKPDNIAMIRSMERIEMIPANYHYRWFAK